MGEKKHLHSPPKEELYVAFAEALDSWNHVESQLMMDLSLLLNANDINAVAAMFNSVVGFRNQLNMVEAVAEQTIKDEHDLTTFKKLIARAGTLSTKRNRIVHGRWSEITHKHDGEVSKIELYIDFVGNLPWGNMPATKDEARKLKGKRQFFLDDLKRAKNEFDRLYGDLFKATDLITGNTFKNEAGPSPKKTD